MIPSDQELAARIGQRDVTAFEALSERYQGALRRHLVQMVRREDEAEDLLQEVFLRVWTHAGQWRGEGSLKAWVFRIATNLALNHLRSRQRRREQPLHMPAEVAGEEDELPAPSWMIDASSLGPDALLELSEQQQLFGRLVDELPEEKREVFRMVYEEEMGVREVAQALGIPEGTVKSRLHDARRRLARGWEDTQTRWEEI